jgi:hypothetical protein
MKPVAWRDITLRDFIPPLPATRARRSGWTLTVWSPPGLRRKPSGRWAWVAAGSARVGHTHGGSDYDSRETAQQAAVAWADAHRDRARAREHLTRIPPADTER